MLTAKLIRSLLKYDPKTGHLYWRRLLSFRARFGIPAGYISKTGYVYIGMYGTEYKAHRLIWIIKTGRWPKADIDHINRARADNRWVNLREATRSQNAGNRIPRTDSLAGLKGVSWHRKNKCWRARIKVNYREISLGLHKTPELAHAAYVIAAKKHFGEFARAA